MLLPVEIKCREAGILNSLALTVQIASVASMLACAPSITVAGKNSFLVLPALASTRSWKMYSAYVSRVGRGEGKEWSETANYSMTPAIMPLKGAWSIHCNSVYCHAVKCLSHCFTYWFLQIMPLWQELTTRAAHAFRHIYNTNVSGTLVLLGGVLDWTLRDETNHSILLGYLWQQNRVRYGSMPRAAILEPPPQAAAYSRADKHWTFRGWNSRRGACQGMEEWIQWQWCIYPFFWKTPCPISLLEHIPPKWVVSVQEDPCRLMQR